MSHGIWNTACRVQGGEYALPAEETLVQAVQISLSDLRTGVYLNGIRLTESDVAELELENNRTFYILNDFQCRTKNFIWGKTASINQLVQTNP